ARLPLPARLGEGLALSAAADRAGAQADHGLRHPRRRPDDARRGALGRQPAEGRRRARGRARPEGARRRAADPRTRRGGDRVRPPAARSGARRRPGDPARLARARGDPFALRPDPGHVRGQDRRRVPAHGVRGRARHRDDRRRQGAGGVSEQQPAGERPTAAPSPQQPESPYPRTFVARLSARYRVGGVVTPIFTTIVAFLAGGIVVGATGHNPLSTYRAIFNGTGLNWFFPWVLGGDRATAATNLQQTLILTTTLILTGLAVAFAFRCGLFNIGGQGQYFVGSYVAIFVGSSWAGLAGPAHIFLAVTFAALAGAAYGGIAGFLKATTGAHEVISTIMLNWIAIWVGNYFFGLAGPFQGPDQFNPISSTVADSAKLPVFWGDPQLQGLHVGIFIALGMLVVFWIVLNRTTLGYEVKAVGFNPDAAEYGGISVKKNYFLAMA